MDLFLTKPLKKNELLLSIAALKPFKLYKLELSIHSLKRANI